MGLLKDSAGQSSLNQQNPTTNKIMGKFPTAIQKIKNGYHLKVIVAGPVDVAMHLENDLATRKQEVLKIIQAPQIYTSYSRICKLIISTELKPVPVPAADS